MTLTTLIEPNYGTRVNGGLCLVMAQNVCGARTWNDRPGDSMRAVYAADFTQYRHHTRAMPDAVCVVWLTHWGNYDDGPGEYGHVVVWDPTAFDGAGGYFSSKPTRGIGPGVWYRTLAAVEREFNGKFRFWSEDINRTRVCGPAAQKEAAMSAAEIWGYPIGAEATAHNNNMPAWQRLSWINSDTAFTKITVMQLSSQIAGLTAAVQALAGSTGADPAAIVAAAEKGAKQALDGIMLRVEADKNPAGK